MILPQAFWDAFERGKYPQTFCDTIFYQIEDFAPHLEGLGYAYSIYREEYAINFFAIQRAFHISLFSTRESHPLLGIINYQPGRKKQEMCYYDERTTENPDALRLLRKISTQLTSKGLELDERSIKGGSLPFQRPIKTMICSVKWRELIETEPEFTPKDRAEQIAVNVELDPITVAGYASSSTDAVVKSEAIQVMKLLGAAKRDITRKWWELKETVPHLSPLERLERIATGEKLDPMTIAWYGSVSIDPGIRSEAYLLFKQLGEAKRDITGKWQELMENKPHLTPQDRVDRISTHEGVDIMTIASYGRFSIDPAVKSEAIHLFNRLGAAKHDITTKWRNLTDIAPSLSPRERAEKIAADIELDPLTVSGHGRASLDLEIRSEAHKAYKQLFESKLGITERWRKVKAKKPHLVPEEIAQQIAIDLKVDPITIGGYGRASPDPEVKAEAYIAFSRLLEAKHDITGRWVDLKANKPDIAPEEIAKQIAADVGLDPTIVAVYGRASPNSIVKSEANLAYYRLLEVKHDITGRWLALKAKEPHLTPEEIATWIAADIGVSSFTIVAYGRTSPEQIVKSEAHIADYRLRKLGQTKMADGASD